MGARFAAQRNHLADVIVIGGGLHGCSTALHLANRGLSVIVIEKDYVGRHASGVNAGGVRRLGRDLAEIPLAVASAKIWENIQLLVNDDCGFKPSCQIKVAETPEQLQQLKTRANRVTELGFNHEKIIDQNTLHEYLPAVSRHCVGGMIVKGDGYANPYRTVQAFRNKCEQLGVRFKQGTLVKNLKQKAGTWFIQTDNGRFETPTLVNCAGAWGGKISAMLGEPVPIKARALMLMITNRMSHFITPVVGAQGRTLSFKQFTNGTVMIGGGYEGKANPQNNETHLDYSGLASSARTASSIFPIMHDAHIIRAWAGIEGMMPDKIPVISPSQNEGAYHAFGFSAHGFQLGPIGGKILSDLILDGKSELPIEPFRIDRFSGVACQHRAIDDVLHSAG